MRLPLLPLLLLAGCATEEPVDGCDFPESPVAPDGVVTESCGYYLLAVGEHLYVSVYVTEPESPCTLELGDGLGAPDPMYSYMGNDAPKWTYDVTAQVPGPDQAFEVRCEDGTTFSLRVDVE